MLKLISKKNNMSKSYSKIRHIQESNSRLEKRFLNERTDIDEQGQTTDNFLKSAQQELNNLGFADVKIEDYVDKDNPVCTPQTDNQVYNTILEKVANWALSQKDVNVLRNEVEKLIAFIKNPEPQSNAPVAEQASAALTTTGLLIGGTITISPVILGIIGVLVLVILVVNIVRLFPENGNRGYKKGKCYRYHKSGFLVKLGIKKPNTNIPNRVLSL